MAAAFETTDLFARLFNDQSQYNLDFPGVGQVLACILTALVLGILIGLVYMFTHRKTGYTQSYVIAMPMLSGLVATIIVMMCLLANSTTGVTAAISLTGAFSLVRFRSAPGDPRDIAYVFFAMVMGTVCGIGFIGYACLIFVIMAAALILFNLLNFAAPKTQDMTLKVTIPEDLNYNGLFDKVFEKYTTNHLLRRVKTTDFGTLFDLIYSVRVRNDADQKKFIDDIRALNGNLNVTLVLYKYDDQIYDTKQK
ncbi:MAG: DUF4956 domain-containing protein [Oscillospiraceae bacterium]|nr:DUF4956 domain-containing protein [Oscillospiraceae bacterium]MCR4759062.1 DUF4956 domain-containing protein [Oscillospiraceae bacterium]